MVAEGVKTASIAMELAARYGIEMPIAAAIEKVVDGEATPMDAYRGLMMRRPGHENDPEWRLCLALTGICPRTVRSAGAVAFDRDALHATVLAGEVGHGVVLRAPVVPLGDAAGLPAEAALVLRH